MIIPYNFTYSTQMQYLEDFKFRDKNKTGFDGFDSFCSKQVALSLCLAEN